MQFCPKCGAMMQAREVKGSEDCVMVCPKCNYREGVDEKAHCITEKQEKVEEVVLFNDKQVNLPETDNECGKCHNKRAYWWIVQTRSADEAPTRFYKCTKCGNTWREYS